MEQLSRRAHREPPTFLSLAGGRLALGHRPKKSALVALASEGCTHVLTLMAEREGAPQVGEFSRATGLRWLWFPLDNGDPLPAARARDAHDLLDQLTSLLHAGGSVFVHCSAGIHRTGMITNALLRRLGLPQGQARAALRELRQVTAEGVGEHRLAWGDRLVAPKEPPQDKLASWRPTFSPEPAPPEPRA